MKKRKGFIKGSLIINDRIEGGSPEELKAAMSTWNRDLVARWRALAEKYGQVELLDQAEALIDDSGNVKGPGSFERLMFEVKRAIIAESNEHELLPLAEHGATFKESKRGPGVKAQAWKDEVRAIAGEISQEGKKVTFTNVTARINRKINADDKSFWLKVDESDEDGNQCVWFRLDDKGNQDKKSFKTIRNYL